MFSIPLIARFSVSPVLPCYERTSWFGDRILNSILSIDGFLPIHTVKRSTPPD